MYQLNTCSQNDPLMRNEFDVYLNFYSTEVKLFFSVGLCVYTSGFFMCPFPVHQWVIGSLRCIFD